MIMDILWIIAPLVGALVGAIIGKNKNRQGAGAVLGFLLGPIGWLVVALGPDMNPKCPMCGGVIVKGAIKCKNCGGDLASSTKPRK